MNLKGSRGFIYLICRRDGSGIYVGQTRNIKARWKDHRYHLKNNKHRNPHLQNAWNKHGESAFEFVIIEQHEEIDSDEMTTAEQHWIDNYRNSEIVVYNSEAPCDSPMLGRKHTQETLAKMTQPKTVEHREKISKAHIGKVKTQEHCLNISIAKKGQTPWLGKYHSEESKDKLAQINRGKKASQETRDKMSKSRIGKIPSLETRKKRSESLKAFYQKKREQI